MTESERTHLIAAAARNHASWIDAAATVTGGGTMRRRGVRWSVTGGGDVSLPFPRRLPRPGLDALLEWARAERVRAVGCWATGLEPTGEIAARLVARGFEWGWRPHWMTHELSALSLDEPDERVALVHEVPEYDDYGRALVALTRRRPRRFWHAVARVDGVYAGHACAHLVGGRLAGAGVYDLDVRRPYRRRGLGRALTLAVCRAAADAGAQIVTLNATGEGEWLYRALGFRSLGHGQTWWIHRAGLRRPPRPALVALAEAAGRGDVAALERLAPSRALVRARLPGNGLGLAHVAAAAGHPLAADWLAERGAPMDAALAWDVGGEARLRALVDADPRVLDQPLDSDGATILHSAVFRGDTALLRAALDLGADAGRRDTTYDATALDWARELGRDELLGVLDGR